MRYGFESVSVNCSMSYGCSFGFQAGWLRSWFARVCKLEILRREGSGYTSKREISVGSKKLSIFPVEFVLKRLEKGKC